MPHESQEHQRDREHDQQADRVHLAVPADGDPGATGAAGHHRAAHRVEVSMSLADRLGPSSTGPPSTAPLVTGAGARTAADVPAVVTAAATSRPGREPAGLDVHGDAAATSAAPGEATGTAAPPEPEGSPRGRPGEAAAGGTPVPAPPTSPTRQQPLPSTALDAASLVHRRAQSPAGGWRRAVAVLTHGAVRPAPSAADLRQDALVRTVQTPIAGTHRVAVISLKGGVGKTTTTIMLGATLASLRGDRVVAVDANPDAGTLGDRLARQTSATLRDLLTDHDEITSWADLARYTSQARSRLEVIANDVDPSVATAVTARDYLQVVDLLGRYYSVILTDSGTGLLHDAMTGVLGCADTLVVVSSGSVDGARSAATTLDWLTAQGHGHLVRQSVTVISAVRPASRQVDLAAMERYFAGRCRAVVRIPFDPHLEVGAETDLDALAPVTRAAYLELAGRVAEDFAARPARIADGLGPDGHVGHAGPVSGGDRRPAPTARFLPARTTLPDRRVA